MQSAESGPHQVAPVIVPIPPHHNHDHDLLLDQVIHHHALHLQVILRAVDLLANPLTLDLYLLADLAHIHSLHSHLLAAHHQLVPSQGQRKQGLQSIYMLSPKGLLKGKLHPVLRR